MAAEALGGLIEACPSFGSYTRTPFLRTAVTTKHIPIATEPNENASFATEPNENASFAKTLPFVAKVMMSTNKPIPDSALGGAH